MSTRLKIVAAMSTAQTLTRLKWKPCCKGLVTLVASVSIAAWAQPRVTPPADQIVLPASVHAASNQRSSLRQVEREWRKDRTNLPAALAYARAVFLLGLSEGDLRWYGSAKAALQPWWDAPALPAEAHFLRALVKQGFHDFTGGIADLSAAIALDPAQAEYWSWRFSLHLLTADMAAARADCNAIAQRFGLEEGQACGATLLYRTGHPQEAIALLNRLVEQADYQGPSAQDWLRYHQGEAYRVAGDYAKAIAVWEKHLLARPASHLVRLSLCELLNQQGRFAEAKRYADAPSPTDALLVQSLLSSRGMKDGDTQRLAEQFESRMNSQAQRGESLIERPTMVYLITYGRDNSLGLKLAAENWATQKEPADAVLLVQAALKADQPKLAQPVIDWMAATGYTDPVLQALAVELKSRLGKS